MLHTCWHTHCLAAFDQWCYTLGVTVTPSVTLSDSPLSPRHPMIEVTRHKLRVTHSGEHHLPHSQCLRITLTSFWVPQAPFSPTTQGSRQSCCPLSRLLPVVVLRVLSHCLFPRTSCCQGSRQAWPGLGHTAQSPGAGQWSPGPLCPSFWLDPWDSAPVESTSPSLSLCFRVPGSSWLPRKGLSALPLSQSAQGCASQEGRPWAAWKKLTTLSE